MTPTTKAGKECRGQFCKNGKVPNGGAYIGNCGICHGLGWLPAPGDALTRKESGILRHIQEDVECRLLSHPLTGAIEWHRMSKSGDYEGDGWLFRLAPAQEEPAAMESVEEAAMAYVRRISFSGSRMGMLRTGFYGGVDWLLSLTPAQLEALRKGKAA